jgi:pimeloyl-ACP methyl ester carboxylesterase
MPQPLIELGGQADAPIMNIALANGFPPQTYLPMLRPFTADYRVVSLPPRALWGDQTPPVEYQNWQPLADDLLAGFSQNGLEDVVAVGHSFGAIASLLAVIKEPERFKALILLDPTILLPNMLDMIEQAWEQDVADMIPLVQGAKRRRREFESVEDAFERFRSKSLFSDWPDEVLRLYVEHGTQAKADGDGIELSWSAVWEAYYFSTVHLTIWDDLPKLDGLVATLILRGGTSDTFMEVARDRVQTLVPSATYDDIAGHGHLFPQSAPEITYERISRWMQNIEFG